MQRYFIAEELSVGKEIILDKDISHHLMNVLREKVGTMILLVDPNQSLFEAEIVAIDSAVYVRAIKNVEQQVELPLDVHIICGLTKKDKPEWIVQKTTELGVRSITFLSMDRSIVKWNDKKKAQKLERFQRIAQEAAEQSHRLAIPQVNICDTLKQLAPLWHEEVVVLADEEQAKDENGLQTDEIMVQSSMSWSELVKNSMKNHAIYAIFGPEGGISSSERAYLSQWAIPKSLGPRILRAETAPLYFLSVISSLTELDQLNKRGE
ncbi:RsmE family RNA methyltransferase [Atopobacter phocae]|uniref:RsmE family RNA methyltransferase n=1 Tax=Atopobacter phocae TaxID=136492 RepID=UPI0004728A3A|nr:RsmE family RNA methyltransferase [Atopobacter phocae]